MASRWAHPLQSVRVRITLAAVLVTGVAVGAAGWALVRSIEDSQIGDLRHDVEVYLDVVASRLEDGVDPQAALEAEPMVPFGPITVTDERGRVVASVEPPDDDEDELGEDVGDQGRSEVKVPGGDQPIAAPEIVVRTADTPDGELTVTAAAPVDQVDRNTDALVERLRVGLPALVALVGVVTWVLVGRALRPVEAIRAEVDAITGSTMHRRVPEPPTNDEIGRLARTMNAMLGRLDTSATQQRQFVSDASHELRSPVAAIRTGLEVARLKGDRANWPAVVDVVLAEESLLEALLDDLLLLAAHDENGASARPATPVDLTALTAAEARRPRRVPVNLSPADARAHVVAGVAPQLARAVSNLVDNAARHAASVVEVGLSSDGGTVRVTVDDDGPGIPPADRERVFERFTRLDDGRAPDEGGSGLGLAVVRAVVTSHHGQVGVEDSPLGGARFVADLPEIETGRHL